MRELQALQKYENYSQPVVARYTLSQSQDPLHFHCREQYKYKTLVRASPWRKTSVCLQSHLYTLAISQATMRLTSSRPCLAITVVLLNLLQYAACLL